jgi:hypothetical protein
MASYPTEWEVHPATHFSTHDTDELIDAPLGMNLLMQMGDDCRSSGCYRITLFGGGHLDIHQNMEDLIPDLPQEFRTLMIQSSFKVHNIPFANNSCSSAWRDLDVLLHERSVHLFDEPDDMLDPANLIKFLQDQKANKTGIGASIRFAVAAGPDKKMRLEVHAMPGQAKVLNSKANLRTDNAVSVLIGHFPINSDLFSGTNPEGIVPIFFAPDPAKTLAALNNNPDVYRYDIGLINNQILHREHLSLTEAHAYLQSRARAAKGVPAFPLAAGPPLAKRPRTEQPATGTFKNNFFFSESIFPI